MKNKNLIAILAGLIIIFTGSWFIYNNQDNYNIKNVADEVEKNIADQNVEVIEGAIEGATKTTNTTTPVSNEIAENKIANKESIYPIKYPINWVSMHIGNEEYSLSVSTSTSVYEFMQNLSANSIKPFSFTAKEYSGIGYFVESINGIENDIKQNKYWIYYINNEPAKVGISDYILKPEDQINWKFEEAKF